MARSHACSDDAMDYSSLLLSDDPAHCWEQELVVALTDKEITQMESVG